MTDGGGHSSGKVNRTLASSGVRKCFVSQFFPNIVSNRRFNSSPRSAIPLLFSYLTVSTIDITPKFYPHSCNQAPADWFKQEDLTVNNLSVR